MTHEEIIHTSRNLVYAYNSLYRTICWCESAQDHLDLDNGPTIDNAKLNMILSELRSAEKLMHAYMIELDSRMS